MRLKPVLSLAYIGDRMKPVLNKVLPFVLSLLVVLTGQGIAASRGVDRAVGHMVLCTGSGPVVVYMDAEGQPTKAPHFCPDYALNLLGAVSIAEPSLPVAPEVDRRMPSRVAENLIALPIPSQPARAPPASV
ncbi:hypothetical protein [Ruegeria atlantica]|uniref:DUF2946 domain-containing protein n=1 Tax=Ruegeria atlantica TaxID=81569 RepID=A0A0P1ECE0_9RHOB|nr:hypothetical protein [Ruegeria atlantica]CUH47296.1 hypothetical protein RUA4292_01464 [Ruegeria atlantica]